MKQLFGQDERIILYCIGIASFLNFVVDIYLIIAKG